MKSEHKSEHSHKDDKHQAHTKLLDRLRVQAEDVARLMSALTEEQLSTRTVSGKWSLKELLCHLLRVQQIFRVRVESMLREDNPETEPYDPDKDPAFAQLVAKPSIDSLKLFLEGRSALTESLAPLTPAEWHRKGRHPEFPNYDVHFQVEYMVHHEAHHIYQMFQRRVPFGKMPH